MKTMILSIVPNPNIDKKRLRSRIPAAGAFHWSWHQLKNFERQGMTYELLLENFSMEKLNSLLYRNCSVNFLPNYSISLYRPN